MPQRNWHYSSDRTGILAYACLPFLWLFSGRNNIFLWATNFDIQSFNTFHRHIAWACTLIAIVHSFGYSIILTDYGKPSILTSIALLTIQRTHITKRGAISRGTWA